MSTYAGVEAGRYAYPSFVTQRLELPVVTCGTRESDTTMHKLDALDQASLRSDIPAFRAGDNVKVHVKVVEGTRSRIQVFQGVVIRRHGGGVGETFTVRKVSFGVGVERTFPLHTPIIDRIEVVTRGDVRRAKLYYLRDLRGKAAKIKEKRDSVPAGKGKGHAKATVQDSTSE